MRTIDQTPSEWASIHRQAQDDLLLVERDALKQLRALVEDHRDSLIAALASVTSDIDASVVIKKSSDDLEDEMTDALEEIRADAREGARDQLHEELLLLGVTLVLLNRNRKDKLAAATTAKSFSAAWAQVSSLAILISETESEFIGRVSKAIDSLDGRVQRIATTEVSQAWNDEHLDAVSRLGPTLEEDSKAVNRWDATLDAKTCSICASHDGEYAPVGESFSGGDLPGFVHPNCRCLSTLVVLPTAKAA